MVNPEEHLFGDHYIVQEKLGQGGLGITNLVKDKKGQLLVLKTLKDEVMTDPESEESRDKYLRNFDREVAKLAICRHPYIVQVENFFYEESRPYLVMEYIDGENLWQRINTNEGKNPLSEAEATRYIRQIGEALIVVHDKGLLHRDVKPQNIMLRTATDEAVLIDFGIAREFIHHVTIPHTCYISEGFAPPEQYDEEAHRGEFTDVYALAATFYCLVTGKMPPRSPNRQSKDRLEQPQGVSEKASNAILAGLQLQPEDRPQSVSDWLKLFDADDLSSERNVDYKRLRDLLKAGEWQDADYETASCMLKAAGKEKERWLEQKDIVSFPSTDLRTINSLWVKYSNGHFGFSVQKGIYQELRGTGEYDGEIWKAFGDRVGWRKGGEWLYYDDLTWEKNFKMSPVGHLP
ncbi:MAG: protein kinase [Okeania sp. SIO2H7]|nr:protein kinase [Okeania sp. SIO2H7]